MDRFEQGLQDPQQEKVLAYCDGCGWEIYEKQQVRVVFDRYVVHDEDECVLMVSNEVWMMIEEYLGLE